MATQGLADVVEKKVLDHLTGKTAYTSPGPLYVALTTVAVAETDTGSTITEPTGVTGYARIQIPTANWNAASGSGTTPSSAVTNAIVQSAALTAGSATCIGFALCSASSAGDVVFFGTISSVTISSTQTPWSIASGALSVTAD